MNSLNTSLNDFVFNIVCITYAESINNLIKYVNQLPFYKLLITPINWNDMKTILPNISSYLIFQMHEVRSIFYFSYMYYFWEAWKKD